MAPFLVLSLGFGFLQAATYLWLERRHRSAWARDLQDVGAHATPRAPLSIRAIALWSIGMGQMLVPGALLAGYGALFNGTGLVGIPGCLLAGRIWALGPALLRAEARAPARARKAATFAYRLNVVVILVALALLKFAMDAMPLTVFLLGYALVSILHARALQYAADVVEALWLSRRVRYGSGAKSPQYPSRLPPAHSGGTQAAVFPNSRQT